MDSREKDIKELKGIVARLEQIIDNDNLDSSASVDLSDSLMHLNLALQWETMNDLHSSNED